MSTALITGASRGLGRLVSLSLASEGIDLILVGRNKPRLLKVASEAKDLNQDIRIAPVQIDLSDGTAVGLIKLAAHGFGGVDIVVNNAAVQGPIGEAWKVSAREFEETIRMNFLVPSEICRAFVPHMIAKGAGWIVNLSGGGATSPRPMFSAYAAAKTALVRFGETLAAECSGLGVRVNSVAPGAFRSGMTSAVLSAGAVAGQTEISVANRLLTDDSGAAEKAAELITYLVAGEGRDISGKLISAIWDDWKSIPSSLNDLQNSDRFTLRRIN